MNRLAVLLLLCIAVSSPLTAQQNQPPFIFTAYGGLFFPAQQNFQEAFGTGSDIIWGVGGSTPIGGPFYITADIGYFRAGSFPSAVDTSIVLEERFIHAGLLVKEHLAQTFFLRFSGGISYGTATQKTSSSHTPEVALDADKKFGYYGGAGVEQMLDLHWSVYADVMYDYKRSRSADLPGDFGGTRLAAGVNLIVF